MNAMCTDLQNLLVSLVSYNHAFSLREAVAEADDYCDVEELKLSATLKRDRRFVDLGLSDGHAWFASRQALIRWFVSFNIRLANGKCFRLSSAALAQRISSLRSSGGWERPPEKAVKAAASLALCAPGCAPEEWVFPLALVLSSQSPDVQTFVGSELVAPAARRRPKAPGETVEDLLALTTERTALVVKLREGLDRTLAGSRRRRFSATWEETPTLDDIGVMLNVTRERVRQLEAKFWQAAGKASARRSAALAVASYLASVRGDLVVDNTDRETPSLMFVAKCAGVPFSRVENLDLTVLGAGQDELDSAINSSPKFPGFLDAANMMGKLADSRLVLTDGDGRRLASRLVESRSGRLNKAQTIYLTLREIGAPGHYSKIAECHNARYPRNATSEHNVHAILSRQAYGVVWTGMRGTFALREWGFEKPEPIFDSVARIVEESHAKTGRPVPMVVIEAEIGKYRRVVNLKSVAIAAHCNPKLHRIGPDSFVPAEVSEDPAEISDDELDSLLAQFELAVSPQND